MYMSGMPNGGEELGGLKKALKKIGKTAVKVVKKVAPVALAVGVTGTALNIAASAKKKKKAKAAAAAALAPSTEMTSGNPSDAPTAPIVSPASTPTRLKGSRRKRDASEAATPAQPDFAAMLSSITAAQAAQPAGYSGGGGGGGGSSGGGGVAPSPDLYNSPEMDEVTVQGKPYPAWLWAVGAGAVALLLNRKR